MAEYLGVLENETTTIAAAAPPPEIPVIVISGAQQRASEVAAHQRLAAASPRGRHLMAARSGHWIPFDEPEVIVDAVRSLVVAAPSMNSESVTMAPAMHALTSMHCPARKAVSAITGSVRLPSVALSGPPTASPVLAATVSVAWLSSVASGTIATTDSTNSSVCA
jgi:hypothetical protein